MNRLSRIALIIGGIVAITAVITAAAFLITVRRPFPQVEGRVPTRGLEDEVHVYRDEFGIPHIYAQNERDLFFAQGYVHAQDRFWQMEFWRRVGQGRLAEMLGPDLVDEDTFIRTVGWNRMAADALLYYQQEAPEYLAVLDAYSAGVNAYLEENEDAFSINHTILGLVRGRWEIEPWEPLDTLSWGVVMSWDLGGNWRDERDIALLNQELGESVAAEILPRFPYEHRPVIAPMEQLVNRRLLEDVEARAVPARADADHTGINWARVNLNVVGEPPALHGFLARDIGSNNWVVSGEHTASGMPLLADDPHLGIQIPSIWYEMHLNAPGWNVAGFTFAGAPGVVIGHNDHIAWGVTNVGPDVQDLYVERINPDDPHQYEFRGEWREMDVHTEVIRVNGGEDVVLEVRETHHGPIISDALEEESDVLALRWTQQEPSRVFRSLLMLNQAEDFEGFREALRYFDVPSQNFVYADIEGNIGYQTPGLIPIRRNHDGVTPVPGWTGEYEWEQFIPYEHLPTILNPESGYIVTANNALVDPDYPYLVSAFWADGDRAERIENMLDAAIARGDVTAEDFAAIHMDSKSLLAESFQPLFQELESDDPDVQGAIDLIREWDLQTRRDSVAAALFEIFYFHLAENVVADELGAAADTYLDNGSAQRVFFHELTRQPEATWWDDVETPEEESYQEVMHQTLEDTLLWFEANLGGEMASWSWSRLHTATFVSEPLGKSDISLLEQLVNRGPVAVDGTSSAVNATSWAWSDPAAVQGHPSLRMIVDLSNFDQSLGIHSTGQSGHPFHEHYDDFIPLWQNGLYHPMWFSRDAVEEATVDHLLLQPAD
ncbi:MAG: penicillin acylase family protein [Candidatus Promineifilaceae bacterium]|nr:penicillin acylase family protein [Candidatus Promineifilaceae bacterium]